MHTGSLERAERRELTCSLSGRATVRDRSWSTTLSDCLSLSLSLGGNASDGLMMLMMLWVFFFCGFTIGDKGEVWRLRLESGEEKWDVYVDI